MKYYLLILLFLLSASTSLMTQTSRESGQHTLIHLDQPFYVTGEIIQYAVHLPATFTGRPVALKVALVDGAGQQITNYHLPTRGANRLSGLIKVPYELRPDVYHLLILGTLRENKRKVKLAEAFIPIYNDLEQTEVPPRSTTAWPGSDLSDQDLQVSVTLTGGPQQRGADIQATVAVTDRQGRPVPATLSVSVTDQRLFGESESDLQWTGGATASAGIQPGLLDDQPYLNGRIFNDAGAAMPGHAFAVYLPERKASLIGETDDTGRFAIAIPDLEGTTDLQFVDLRGETWQIDLTDEIELGVPPPLPGNEAVNTYLKWSRSRKMIYQLYNTLEAAVEQTPMNPPAQQLTPDQRVIIAEYPNFKDLATFLNEVSTPLKMRTDQDGQYYAQMFNPNPRMRAFYQGNPVFIVDGKITRDAHFIQQLPLSRIDTLDLYFDFLNLNRSFGKLGNSGVAIIRTSLPDLELPPADEAARRTWHGWLPSSQVVRPTPTTTEQPVLRPQVYWSSDQQTGQDGRTEFSFVHTDDPGSFVITVAARSADGRFGYTRHQFDVQW